jgi:hypothetical protein
MDPPDKIAALNSNWELLIKKSPELSLKYIAPPLAAELFLKIQSVNEPSQNLKYAPPPEALELLLETITFLSITLLDSANKPAPLPEVWWSLIKQSIRVAEEFLIRTPAPSNADPS